MKNVFVLEAWNIDLDHDTFLSVHVSQDGAQLKARVLAEESKAEYEAEGQAGARFHIKEIKSDINPIPRIVLMDNDDDIDSWTITETTVLE